MGRSIKLPTISAPRISIKPADLIAPVAQLGSKAVGGLLNSAGSLAGGLISPIAQLGTQAVGGLLGGLMPKGGGGGSSSAGTPAPTGNVQTGTQSWQVPGDPNWQGTPTQGFAPNNPYAAPRVDPRRSLLRNNTLGNQSTTYQFQPRFDNLRGYLGNQIGMPTPQPNTPVPAPTQAPAQPVQTQPQQPMPPAQPVPPTSQQVRIPEVKPVDSSTNTRNRPNPRELRLPG